MKYPRRPSIYCILSITKRIPGTTFCSFSIDDACPINIWNTDARITVFTLKTHSFRYGSRKNNNHSTRRYWLKRSETLRARACKSSSGLNTRFEQIKIACFQTTGAVFGRRWPNLTNAILYTRVLTGVRVTSRTNTRHVCSIGSTNGFHVHDDDDDDENRYTNLYCRRRLPNENAFADIYR